jgi:uncharacterized protein YndB with AHSA1/START domain
MITTQTTKIKIEIKIKSTPAAVWEVLTSDQYIHLWCKSFSTIADIESSWQKGSKVQFISTDGTGLIGTIIERTETEMIIEYDGILDAGGEDFTSEAANAVKHKQEHYFIRNIDKQSCMLAVEADVEDPFRENSLREWNDALSYIKDLAEQSAKNA